MNSRKYFLLAVVSLVVYLILKYSGIYSSSGWAQNVVIILLFTFTVVGISTLSDEKKDRDGTAPGV